MATHVLAGAILSVIGGVFLILAAVGLLRMPDVYNRMQAGTKATTLGSIMFLLGIGVAYPDWLGRIVVLIAFIAFTNPISSHALIRAAHAVGIPLAETTVKDDLARAEEARRAGAAEAEENGDDGTAPEKASVDSPVSDVPEEGGEA